jgi:hypothetical protein
VRLCVGRVSAFCFCVVIFRIEGAAVGERGEEGGGGGLELKFGNEMKLKELESRPRW